MPTKFFFLIRQLNNFQKFHNNNITEMRVYSSTQDLTLSVDSILFANVCEAEHVTRTSLSAVKAVEAGTHWSVGFSGDNKTDAAGSVPSDNERNVPGIPLSLRFSPRARRSFSAHFAALST